MIGGAIARGVAGVTGWLTAGGAGGAGFCAAPGTATMQTAAAMKVALIILSFILRIDW
jgi:hypothetical protein